MSNTETPTQENEILEIPAQEGSSITSSLSLELGNVTTLAGENNAGKSSILKAIKKKEGKGAILIQSDKVSASAEVKASGPSPFRDIISVILKEIFKQDPKQENTKHLVKKIQDDLNEQTKSVIDSVNGFLEETRKEFDIKVQDITHEVVLKNLIEPYAKDLYRESEKVSLEQIGQGTQRLIIAGLLVYLARSNSGSKIKYILFEEPEAFLHPKLKKKLYEALLRLSESYRVIISTHDPYFIELSNNQKIYRVFRDSENGNATAIKPVELSEGVLDYDSDAETNYIIFGVASTDYLLQLYQKAKELEGKRKKEVERLGESYTSPSFKDIEVGALTVKKIRDTLAHRTTSTGQDSQQQPNITEDMKKDATKELRDFLVSLTNQ